MTKAASVRELKRARFIAVQSLYQWAIARPTKAELLAHARVDNPKNPPSWVFFDELVSGVLGNYASLDELYSFGLDRPIEQVSPIEKAILRLGTFELRELFQTPVAVVLNEYVQLAKQFGAQDSFKFINSVLQQVASTSRVTELKDTNASQLDPP